jgi:glycosyltransferase involved in cell wall biosynthesis
MPLRIVIDVRRIRDFGIGTYIRSLVHALGEIDTENRYTLISHPDDVRTLSLQPKNFTTVPYAPRAERPAEHVAFPLYLRSLAPDLIHIPLNRVPLLMIKPYVVTIHDMANLLFEEESGWRMALRRYRFRRGLIRADRIIAVSEATSREVQKSLNIPASRIRMVYNAPDPEFFTHRHSADARAAGPDAATREKLRILERYQVHYPYLLYAGNIKPHKNIPRLVEAFAVVRDQLASHPVYKDLRLIIIGDQISQYPAVRHAVIKSRVENTVRFLGFVPFDTLRCFYESAAAFVFPSRHEGFGLPPLEAMASGTPVVCSNVSSLPEVVGDAAIQVNPENVFDIARGIREVLLDEHTRQEMIARGKAQAKKFSWSRTAREVLEIYREVAGRTGSERA